jgi:hypothetical protein
VKISNTTAAAAPVNATSQTIKRSQTPKYRASLMAPYAHKLTATLRDGVHDWRTTDKAREPI